MNAPSRLPWIALSRGKRLADMPSFVKCSLAKVRRSGRSDSISIAQRSRFKGTVGSASAVLNARLMPSRGVPACSPKCP
jgi:hypothetical protein